MGVNNLGRVNQAAILEELIAMIDTADKKKWGDIDDIICEYSKMSILTNIPPEQLPTVLNKIKNTLS